MDYKDSKTDNLILDKMGRVKLGALEGVLRVKASVISPLKISF